MHRRLFVLLCTSFVIACSHEPTSPSHKGTEAPRRSALGDRPNIVFILTDDQALSDMRAMPETRSLIGNEGVTFDNYIDTYALCCPARATFLTGQYPHNHGVQSNASPDGGFGALDHSNTLPLWLQEVGYTTAYIGKYMNGYGRADPLEIVPGWTEWYASTGGTDAYYFTYKLNENGTIVSYGTAAEDYKSDVFTRKGVDFIHRHAADAGPFFLYVSYFAPHGGNPLEPGDPIGIGTPVPAPRHKGRFAGEVIPPAASFNEADMSDKPASMQQRPLLTLNQINAINNSHRQRLESLLAVDEGVAQIVDALRAENVLEHTLMFFTSDNGWFQGQHRIRKGKVLPYEAAVKLPLLVRGPGIAGSRHIPAPVANIDLAPTIVQAAGATAQRTMDGRSLWPFLYGGQTTWLTGNGPRHLLVEDSQLGLASTVFWSIRRGFHVYTEYGNGDREYYNLKTDPDQLTSRHKDPTAAKIRQQLAARLAAMKSCVGPVACW